MAFAEKRGNTFRARWVGPDGSLESKSGFKNKRDAERYGQDQEAAIRAGSYVDPRAGQITLADWVNVWFPAQDLELSTMSNYRYQIEVLILPTFGHRTLASLTAEEIALWERHNVDRGYSRRTAGDARSTLGTVLADAVPRHIQVNPAVRRKGKGRKGKTRLARLEKAEKTWATPLEALLVAERCALLAGQDSTFTMMVTAAYTGMRWSEINALSPKSVRPGLLDVHWKLYELNGRFYRGRPKDGSVRTVDLPPFLSKLLTRATGDGQFRCLCSNKEQPWCTGTHQYLFLGPQGGHYRRSTYARRVLRPAVDGWYPAAGKKTSAPVLVDATCPPGEPLPPWPATSPDEPFVPPAGRGHRRIPDETPVASWLPVLNGLTAHGLRHSHQTWLDEARIREVLQSERMGHEVPGMRGVYVHITPTMRTDLVTALEQMWADALAARARMHRRSPVATLDAVLASHRSD